MVNFLKKDLLIYQIEYFLIIIFYLNQYKKELYNTNY